MNPLLSPQQRLCLLKGAEHDLLNKAKYIALKSFPLHHCEEMVDRLLDHRFEVSKDQVDLVDILCTTTNWLADIHFLKGYQFYYEAFNTLLMVYQAEYTKVVHLFDTLEAERFKDDEGLYLLKFYRNPAKYGYPDHVTAMLVEPFKYAELRWRSLYGIPKDAFIEPNVDIQNMLLERTFNRGKRWDKEPIPHPLDYFYIY